MSIVVRPDLVEGASGEHALQGAAAAFVLRWGWRASGAHLASVLECTRQAIDTLRRKAPCRELDAPKGFAELFELWHGRSPLEDDWPAPEVAASGHYEWQAPEQALLASLVGQISVDQIASALTARLRLKSGDETAERSKVAVIVRMSQMGLQTSDVVGGLTITEAAREVGSIELVHHALKTGRLPAHRVGRLWVISHEGWAAWKKSRVKPPESFVLLSHYREPLGIKSDKLSEFARMGYVPTAERFTPIAAGPSTKFGTWWVDRARIERIVADRHAGLPMPWQGKPLMDNLRATFRLWERRKHPRECKDCQRIWGVDFQDYVERYPDLDHGAKRHLSRLWTPGLTPEEAATRCKCELARVVAALDVGTLPSTLINGVRYCSRTDVTLWMGRGMPIGRGQSWATLPLAARLYCFTEEQLRSHIAAGTIKSRVGTDGAARGLLYVLKQDCRVLRDRLGIPMEQAAQRVGVSVDRMRVLLKGVDWRGLEDGIPLGTLQAVVKRHKSRPGYTLEEAAQALGQTLEWLQARVEDGTVRVSRAPWDHQLLHLSEPMFERLRLAASAPAPQPRTAGEWVRLSQAALDAGVCNTVMLEWGRGGEVTTEQRANGRHYLVSSVRARARLHWQTQRRRRARPPQWLALERASRGPQTLSVAMAAPVAQSLSDLLAQKEVVNRNERQILQASTSATKRAVADVLQLMAKHGITLADLTESDSRAATENRVADRTRKRRKTAGSPVAPRAHGCRF